MSTSVFLFSVRHTAVSTPSQLAPWLRCIQNGRKCVRGMCVVQFGLYRFESWGIMPDSTLCFEIEVLSIE